MGKRPFHELWYVLCTTSNMNHNHSDHLSDRPLWHPCVVKTHTRYERLHCIDGARLLGRKDDTFAASGHLSPTHPSTCPFHARRPSTVLTTKALLNLHYPSSTAYMCLASTIASIVLININTVLQKTSFTIPIHHSHPCNHPKLTTYPLFADLTRVPCST